MTLEVEVLDGPSRKRDATALIPSVQLPDDFGREARLFCEADEEAWDELRMSIFGATPPPPVASILGEIGARRARCLVDATSFEPGNIRKLLPLFEKVAISLPLAIRMESNLAGLGVTESELLHLAEIGRVELLLPMSLDRYSPDLVGKLLERAPKAVLGPRRLAAAVVAFARDRVPFLYPGVGVKERHEGLRLLEVQLAALESVNREAARAGRVLISELREAWSYQEFAIQRRGVLASSAFGSGPIMAAFAKEFAGRDLLLELHHAGQHVEMAAAIGATIIPVEGKGFTTQNSSELCASFYSGAPPETAVLQFADMTTALDDVLGLDGDVPIREVAEVFQGRDVDRLRELLINLTSHNQDPETLREALEGFNAKVRAFDRSAKNVSRFGVVGALSAIAAATGVVAAWVPFTVLAVGFLLAGPEYKGAPGWVLDTIRGANAGVSADVVLVSRLKRR